VYVCVWAINADNNSGKAASVCSDLLSCVCIHSFAVIVDIRICIGFCSLCMQVELVSQTLITSLALLPAALPATARAFASHASMLCRHSTLVLSPKAINCRSVELIVKWIVVFPFSSDNYTDSWLSAILVTGRLIVFHRISIVLTVCVHSNRAVAAV